MTELMPCRCGAPSAVIKHDLYSGCQVGCSVDCESSLCFCRPLGCHEEAIWAWNEWARGSDADL